MKLRLACYSLQTQQYLICSFRQSRFKNALNHKYFLLQTNSYRLRDQQVKADIHSMQKSRWQAIKVALTVLLCGIAQAPLAAAQNTAVPASACQTNDRSAPSDYIQSNPSDQNSSLPAGVDPQTGFRMQRYRSAVPDSNPGTEVVDTTRAMQLHRSGQVIFIDVYPPRGLGADPLNGNWLTNEPHSNIENSVWLPEVGRGHLEQDHIDYFQRNLSRLTTGDKQTALLFYCTADCWQSWNAARRAMLWGYKNIFWYPDGTDGWHEENHPLIPATPVNFHGN